MGFFKDTGILSDDDVMEIDGDSLAELASKINKTDAPFDTVSKKSDEDFVKDSEKEEDEVKPEKKEEPVETKKSVQSEKETKEDVTEKKKETKTRTAEKTKTAKGAVDFDKFFIPEGIKVSGDIRVDGEALICGDFSGTITASQNIFVDTKEIARFSIRTDSDVLIDENSVFVGNIECKNAAIKGKVKGNIRTEDMLYVANNALVVGDVTTKRLNVEDSGRIVGGVHLDTGDTDIDTKEIFGE